MCYLWPQLYYVSKRNGSMVVMGGGGWMCKILVMMYIFFNGGARKSLWKWYVGVWQETGLGVKKIASFPHNFTTPYTYLRNKSSEQFRRL